MQKGGGGGLHIPCSLPAVGFRGLFRRDLMSWEGYMFALSVRQALLN